MIITSAGENVAPVLLENAVKEELKFLSNAMVVGDARKYLTIVLTLPHKLDQNLKIVPNTLEPDTVTYLAQQGVQIKTAAEAVQNATLKKIIDEGIQRANNRAISRA
jgi:long-chain-fatty-acid--CoA ligase ACSBG